VSRETGGGSSPTHGGGWAPHTWPCILYGDFRGRPNQTMGLPAHPGPTGHRQRENRRETAALQPASSQPEMQPCSCSLAATTLQPAATESHSCRLRRATCSLATAACGSIGRGRRHWPKAWKFNLMDVQPESKARFTRVTQATRLTCDIQDMTRPFPGPRARPGPGGFDCKAKDGGCVLEGCPKLSPRRTPNKRPGRLCEIGVRAGCLIFCSV
jgi:hypothetical protein